MKQTLPGQVERPDDEALVNGVPHRLLDGYDGDGAAPPQEFIDKLMADAPDYIKQRLAEVTREHAALDFHTPSPEEALRLRLTQEMPAKWVLIENEGALFRGPARGVPREVWNRREQAFEPYRGNPEKPIEWGYIIGVDEAMALCKSC